MKMEEPPQRLWPDNVPEEDGAQQCQSTKSGQEDADLEQMLDAMPTGTHYKTLMMTKTKN